MTEICSQWEAFFSEEWCTFKPMIYSPAEPQELVNIEDRNKFRRLVYLTKPLINLAAEPLELVIDKKTGTGY